MTARADLAHWRDMLGEHLPPVPYPGVPRGCEERPPDHACGWCGRDIDGAGLTCSAYCAGRHSPAIDDGARRCEHCREPIGHLRLDARFCSPAHRVAQRDMFMQRQREKSMEFTRRVDAARARGTRFQPQRPPALFAGRTAVGYGSPGSVGRMS